MQQNPIGESYDSRKNYKIEILDLWAPWSLMQVQFHPFSNLVGSNSFLMI